MKKGHLVYIYSTVDAETLDLLIDEELREKQKEEHSLQSVVVTTCFCPKYQDVLGRYENVLVHTACVVFCYPVKET